MMQSVALNDSAIYPEDDEYVVVEAAVVPSSADPLYGISAGGADEEEYDYCDDIECDSATQAYIEQSISFEEVSDHLCSSSKFSFGDEAEQLLLEIDKSSSSSSTLMEMSESAEIPAPRIFSSPSEYDQPSESVVQEEQKAVSSQEDETQQSKTVVTSSVPAKPSLGADKQAQPKQQPQPQQSGTSTASSRMSNKKRRKQMKLAKKAAAAAAAAASLAQLSTMGHHYSIGNNSSPSHPSRRNKTNASATTTTPRGKNKRQVTPNNIAVACAVQTLADYRLELQQHHRNSTGTAKLVR